MYIIDFERSFLISQIKIKEEIIHDYKKGLKALEKDVKRVKNLIKAMEEDIDELKKRIDKLK